MYVAWPELRVTVARVVAPSLKAIVPVGVPVLGDDAVTVAVKVTVCPETEGLAEDVSAVVVPALLTVWVKLGAVLGLKLPSPLYTAVMAVWLPAAKVVVLNVACPALRLLVASAVVPSLKVTVPVGLPVPGATGATVAVNVIDWPYTV